MPFNENKQLDPSQVQDRRGSSRGRTIAVGGGGVSLLLILVVMLLGGNPADLLNNSGIVASNPDSNISEVSDLAAACQTGADANARQDCAIVGYVNSIQSFWTDEFAASGGEYAPAQTVLFSGATEAGCGYASGASGPFYCPRDQGVYLDLAFFDALQARMGVGAGSFAQAYVLAHEYGHHVQDVLGILEITGDRGPQSMSVYTELQADCLAGVWIYHAVETGYFSQLTDAEIAQSLEAATAVGDDRMQKSMQGYVSPETWTHGSSKQRQAALYDGLQSGDINTCETPGWTN